MSGRLDRQNRDRSSAARAASAKASSPCWCAKAPIVVHRDLREDLGGEISKRHAGSCEFFRGDMSKRADMQALAAATCSRRHGRIDILCQVAGIYPNSLLEDMAGEEWDLVLAVNLKGPFLAIQACFPAMKKQRTGASCSPARSPVRM